MSATASPPLPPASPLRKIFFGPHGLRAGWSLLIFLALSAATETLVVGAVRKGLSLPENPAWTPELFIAWKGFACVLVLSILLVLGRIEGRSLAAYGISWRSAFGKRFWEGALWGILTISAVIALMALVGAYTVAGLALSGREIAVRALLWALALLVAGFFEEIYFRGYSLFTLSRGLGFWPAALLLSLIFGADHYFFKPLETWVDFLSVGLIGLFFCFTVRRTGDIWWATGWHFTYNFGSAFLYGGPNTGNQGKPFPGHLLDSTFHGSDWLTGGPMGPEASLFIFPMIALLFWAFHRRYQEARFPEV